MIAKENFSPSVAEPVKAEENQKLADDKEITKEEEALSKLNRHGESKPHDVGDRIIVAGLAENGLPLVFGVTEGEISYVLESAKTQVEEPIQPAGNQSATVMTQVTGANVPIASTLAESQPPVEQPTHSADESKPVEVPLPEHEASNAKVEPV
ncbi:unnamed protein product, partial [Enterobius vermicularis]|uniref:Signal peptide protein n=1 Tax=Enterobius vermicularis TaxID=51028 RepID=A0A0N4UTK9_ENTVE